MKKSPKPSPKDRTGLDTKAGSALHPSECAARLACHVDHIYDLVEEGQIKAVEISGANNLTSRRCLRIPSEAFEDFLKRRASV